MTDPSRDRPVDPRHVWRERDERTAPLGDIYARFFDKRYARPHRQLGQLADVWRRLVPETLHARTALRSLHRGVLTVAVDDSATLYQLDRVLRGGVENEIKQQINGAVRRIKLEQAGDA